MLVNCDSQGSAVIRFDACELRLAGYGCDRFDCNQSISAGFHACTLKDAGFGAGPLRAAGLGVAELKGAGFNACQLRHAGFDGGQLILAGFRACQLTRRLGSLSITRCWL